MIKSPIINIDLHPKRRSAARLIDLLTGVPQATISTQPNTDHDKAGQVTVSLCETLERWENELPIPDPDFCASSIADPVRRKAYDRKVLGSSSSSERPQVLNNIIARLSGLETGSQALKDDAKPPRLDIEKDDLFVQDQHLKDQIKTSLDIDSAMSIDFPLNMINVHINLSFVPKRARTIDSSMHIEVSRKRGLNRTRHFYFGYFGSAETQFELYVLLPEGIGESKEARSSSTRVPDCIIKAWMNEIVLKAAKSTLPHVLRSQWPTTYENEVAKCEAVQEVQKLRSHNENELGHLRRKPRFQVLPREYIGPFWEECMSLLKSAIDAAHPELGYFKDFKLFCHMKNVKDVVYEHSGSLKNLVHTMDTKVNWSNRNFDNQILKSFVTQLIDTDKFWLDLAMTHYIENDGYTLMWKTAYLKKMPEAVAGARRPQISRFHWCHTEQIGSIGFQFQGHEVKKRKGVYYSQFYLPNKNQFAASGTYPWSFKDEILQPLLLSDTFMESLMATEYNGARFTRRDC